MKTGEDRNEKEREKKKRTRNSKSNALNDYEG